MNYLTFTLLTNVAERITSPYRTANFNHAGLIPKYKTHNVIFYICFIECDLDLSLKLYFIWLVLSFFLKRVMMKKNIVTYLIEKQII